MTKSELIEKASKIHVLVLGDIMIDRYLHGKVERKSPEADVPVVHHLETIHSLGGAANVAKNFKALGCSVSLISLIGEDEQGRELNQLLKEEGIKSYNIQDNSRPTTVKTRILNGTDHLLRVDFESTEVADATIQEKILDQVRTIIKEGSVNMVVFQDYDKGFFSPTLIHDILTICEEHQVFTAVDPKFKSFWDYKSVDLFKPNLKEVRQAMNAPNSSDYENLSKEALSRLSAKTIVLTLSELGIMIVNDSGEVEHQRPPVVEIMDVCGAGDAVLSIVSLLSYLQAPLNTIAMYGNRVGTQVCSKSGVVAVNVEELPNEPMI